MDHSILQVITLEQRIPRIGPIITDLTNASARSLVLIIAMGSLYI